MRIAISGTHFSGKTSLIEVLSSKLNRYEVFEEPYLILEESGYDFSDPPTIEDFEKQLECSVELIEEAPKNAIFDRSPFDFLAYAQVLSENSGDDLDLEAWSEQVEEALPQIDVLFFLPIESPDLIKVPRSEDSDLRYGVDEKLRELILEDSLGLLKDVTVFEVTGSLQKRADFICNVLNRS